MKPDVQDPELVIVNGRLIGTESKPDGHLVVAGERMPYWLPPGKTLRGDSAVVEFDRSRARR